MGKVLGAIECVLFRLFDGNDEKREGENMRWMDEVNCVLSDCHRNVGTVTDVFVKKNNFCCWNGSKNKSCHFLCPPLFLGDNWFYYYNYLFKTIKNKTDMKDWFVVMKKKNENWTSWNRARELQSLSLHSFCFKLKHLPSHQFIIYTHTNKQKKSHRRKENTPTTTKLSSFSTQWRHHI